MALARHLMNVEENEHVHVHELRGFVSQNLEGAFSEAYAISLGTQCKQFLFSLSLSPPENEIVPIDMFEKALIDIEEKMGLAGQPRALVFHEKQGRRHAHCVWSRIDSNQMRAINLPYFKMKLKDISRALFLEYGWQMPRGLENGEERDPLNFSQAEFQQAKRSKQNVQDLKKMFQSCWSSSDGQAAFANALLAHGFHLAKGDRRGYVAVDWRGEVYSISRWVGVTAKEVRARLGEGDGLLSVDEAKQKITKSLSTNAKQAREKFEALFEQEQVALEAKRIALVTKHREARDALSSKHEVRQIAERISRSTLLPKGLKAAWFRVSGKYETLKRENEKDLQRCLSRDRSEFQKLIEKQLLERRNLQREFRQLHHNKSMAIASLYRSMGEFLISQNENLLSTFEVGFDPKQPLVLLDEAATLFTADQVRKYPERILEIITDKKEMFSRYDIVRGLSDFIADPLRLSAATEEVLKNKELIKVQDGSKPVYTTREMQQLNSSIATQVRRMAGRQSFQVSSYNIRSAIQRQNTELKKSVGAKLSDEQIKAIKHILGPTQISSVVGFAGAGKSTMLAAANEAWTSHGYRVRGATLSGKAADGLQEASGIDSRTLASLEMSWKNGFNKLEPHDVIVIDEAAMVGVRQMKRFIDEVVRCGAQLVLVGDPEQLQPIMAGKPFLTINNEIGSVELTEIRRQKYEWQRQASRDFAQNRPVEALKAYEDHGAIEISANSSEAISKLVQDYMIDLELHGAGSSRMALAYRRKDVHAINQGIRMARKLGGELEDEKLFKTKYGPRAFANGDPILFTKNDTELGVRNGSQGIVENVSEHQITVSFDMNGQGKSRLLIFSPKRYTDIDHGYASTIHKSQGMTVNNVFVLSSRQMDRHLTYVSMSRHKQSAKLYLDSSSPLSLENKHTQTRKQTRALTRRR